jgi:hypothetical protein
VVIFFAGGGLFKQRYPFFLGKIGGRSVLRTERRKVSAFKKNKSRHLILAHRNFIEQSTLMREKGILAKSSAFQHTLAASKVKGRNAYFEFFLERYQLLIKHVTRQYFF